MFCPKCGVKLPENSKFCNACGFDLSKPAVEGVSSAEGEPLDEITSAGKKADVAAVSDSEAPAWEKLNEYLTGWSSEDSQAAPAPSASDSASMGAKAGTSDRAASEPAPAEPDEANSKYRLGVIGLLGLSLFLMFLPWVESKYMFGNSSYTMLGFVEQVRDLAEYGGSSMNGLVVTASLLFVVWLLGLALGGFSLFVHLRKMDSFLGFFRFSLLSPALAGVICAFGIMSVDQSLHSAIGSAGSSYGSTGRAVANAVGSGVGLGVGIVVYLCVAASIAAFVLSRKVKEEEGE